MRTTIPDESVATEPGTPDPTLTDAGHDEAEPNRRAAVAPIVRVLRRPGRGRAVSEARARAVATERPSAPSTREPKRRIRRGDSESIRGRVLGVGCRDVAPRTARDARHDPGRGVSRCRDGLAGIPQLSAQLPAHRRQRARSRRRHALSADEPDRRTCFSAPMPGTVQNQLIESTIYRAAFSQRQLYQRMVEFWTDHFNQADRQGRLPARRRPARRDSRARAGQVLGPASGERAQRVDVRVPGPEHEQQPRAEPELRARSDGAPHAERERTVHADRRRRVVSRAHGLDDDGQGRCSCSIPAIHDWGAKTVLGVTIPAGSPSLGQAGIKEGEQILNFLAAHPSTATFISTKLLKWFISETPTDAQIAAIASVFRATGGDIKAVVRAVLNDVWLPTAPMKYKRPFHYLVSSIRSANPTVTTTSFFNGQLNNLGQAAFRSGKRRTGTRTRSSIGRATSFRAGPTACRCRRSEQRDDRQVRHGAVSGRLGRRRDRHDQQQLLRRRNPDDDARRRSRTISRAARSTTHECARRSSSRSAPTPSSGTDPELTMTEHDLDCGCQEYNELSRRQFLATSAGVSAAALFPAWLPKIVMAKNYSSSRDIIISIFQRGGADGLSIAVPFADPNYYTARPTIAIPRPDATRRHARREPRRLLRVPAGDGRRNRGGNRRSHARVPGAGPADRARDGAAQQLALALRRAALHGSRQAGRPDDHHGLAGAPSRQHSAAQSDGAAARHRRFERFAENARRRSADAADRRSDELFHRRIERDAGGARRVPAGRLYRRRRSGRPLGPQRHEHDRPAQVGELQPATRRPTARSIRTAVRSRERCARSPC